VALTDGSLARAGGKVIKNVAGYDLNRLFAGSFGTLGLIVEVVVRLNPLPSRRATVVGRSDDPLVIQRGAIALSRAPLELEALDLRWQERQGMLLARIAGVAPEERVESAVAIMRDAGLDAAAESNEEGAERSPGSGSDNGLGIWVAQRALQRSDGGAVVRVATVRSELARVLEVAGRLGASVAGRAGIGQIWVNFPRREDASVVAAIGALRASLSPRPCVVQDAPEPVRDNVDVWGEAGPLGLMRRIKERFDPHGVCNRGIFVGGI